MKTKNKLLKIAIVAMFSVVAFFNALTMTNDFSSDSVSLDFIIKQAYADGESGGGTKKHSQVVGCGSKRFEDWAAGCCAGTGGCTDDCNKTPEYCD